MSDAVIVEAVESPMGKGKRGGALSGVHAVDLLAQTLGGLFARVGVDPARAQPARRRDRARPPARGVRVPPDDTMLSSLEQTGGRYGLQTMFALAADLIVAASSARFADTHGNGG